MSAKIVGTLQSTLSKLNALQKPIVYNTKVAAEVAKQVYTKEGMSFPSGEQFAQAQQTVQKSLNMSAWKNLTVRDVAKGGVVAAELYTFFLIGEIVGRRNLIGYDVKPAVEHHEH
ncbi:mitochondrial ATP synthase g subunit-domain-containing protein [Zychaea mexicana]|uniref:mitochondrial ATP synthase g subunit-domain-containing protein n=1 Tax=Zychaea mexicana TaxID=64656 RepID=UPI0022FEF227|nr:mitochondrial ATP synthase g subunit-domain-containing protein [Zychaea mexicana]KAI9498432.1 mitochondrial ATP synthase g subunit-domain-containing protein [Zychaea mexicana]